MDVMLAAVMALNAYSVARVDVRTHYPTTIASGDLPTWYKRPWSEKIVMWRS